MSWLRQAGGGVRSDSDIVLRRVSGKVRRVNHEELLKNARGHNSGRVVKGL